MSKAYTQAQFSQQVADDRTWRLKEISDLKSAVERADARLRTVLLRAIVALCYAHWEGSVRFCARKYLQYIALRKFDFQVLNRQFLRNYFLPRLAGLALSNSDLATRCQLVDEILNAPSRQFRQVNEDLVNTRANLSSSVMSDICLVCAVDAKPFTEQADFIDLILLKRRNSIAHGEDTFIAFEDLGQIVYNTVELMRAFGDALENHVVAETFRAA